MADENPPVPNRTWLRPKKRKASARMTFKKARSKPKTSKKRSAKKSLKKSKRSRRK
jgi:hypothetical protein